MTNFKHILDSTNKATEKQKVMIEHNKRFLNVKLSESKLKTLSKSEASELIKEIIMNKNRYYTEMVEF